MLAAVVEKFGMDFDIFQHVFVADAHLAMSPDLKALRGALGDMKTSVTQVNIIILLRSITQIMM